MRVLPLVEPEKVKLSGPGVSSKGVPASVPTEFTIDTSNAGFGDLELQVVVRNKWFAFSTTSTSLFKNSSCRIFSRVGLHTFLVSYLCNSTNVRTSLIICFII